MKPLPAVILCCFLLGQAIPAVRADTIQTDSSNFKQARIIGIRAGRLYFQDQTRQEHNVVLSQVKNVELDAFPSLASANQAFARKDYATATDIYKTIVDRSREEYVQVLIGARLVTCLDQTDRFAEAAKRYAHLLAINAGPLTRSARPVNYPTKLIDRSRTIDAVKTLADNTSDPLALKYLEQTLEDLIAGKQAPELQFSATTASDGVPDVGYGIVDDAIEKDLKAGRAASALRRIDQRLSEPGVSMSQLLYQKGQALAALGKDNDALIAYMRIIIHYAPHTAEKYGPALVEAGKLFAKQGAHQHARNLWKQALEVFPSDSQQAGAIRRLMERSP